MRFQKLQYESQCCRKQEERLPHAKPSLCTMAHVTWNINSLKAEIMNRIYQQSGSLRKVRHAHMEPRHQAAPWPSSEVVKGGRRESHPPRSSFFGPFLLLPRGLARALRPSYRRGPPQLLTSLLPAHIIAAFDRRCAIQLIVIRVVVHSQCSPPTIPPLLCLVVAFGSVLCLLRVLVFFWRAVPYSPTLARPPSPVSLS